MIRMSDFYYIYNQRQADFFYKSGLEIIEIGQGSKGDTFIKFRKDGKSKKIFDDWMKHKDDKLLK